MKANTMLDGQADTAPTLDDVARFMVDNPEADRDDEPTPADEPADAESSDTALSEGDEPETPTGEDDEPAEGDASEEPQGQQGGKHKVTVKGADGADQTIEVDTKELVAGYQRHADYTRKTQELANREREAHEVVSRKLQEGSAFYQQEAQKAVQTIRALAGLKTEQELWELAQRDPAAAQAEMLRQRAVESQIAQIEQGVQAEAARRQQESVQADQTAFARCWGVLGQKGLDKPQVQAIFEGIMKNYDVPRERFARLSDPALVLIMQDAMKFRQLQEKTASVKARVAQAPKLPAQRQTAPRSSQVNKRLDAKFRSGKAGTRDLASWIANNS